MKKEENPVKKRHTVYYVILKALIEPFLLLTYHYKVKSRYNNKKQNVFIVSNHQTDIDAIFMCFSFNRYPYFLATDSITSNRFWYKILNHILGIVTKKKGSQDSSSVKKIIRITRNRGSVAIFPEGNRTYAEFQYPVTTSLSKLIKVCNIPLVIFNIHGGTGTSPRFRNKRRKGSFYGEIKTVLSPEEYKKMSDEELRDFIMDNLKVYDSESGDLYKSNRRAEYLERMLFVCPTCNKMNTLYSKGNYLYCHSCGLKVEYKENMHLSSDLGSFKFDILNDWYQYQKEYVRNTDFNGLTSIFKDEDVKLYISNANKQRKLISKGNIELTNNNLLFDNGRISFDIKKIYIASVISGKNFNFTVDDNCYLVKGHKKFNPLKYVLMFNKLDTDMKLNKRDEYYSLD